MAQYQHLPIYRLTYELLQRVMALTKEFPREYKFTLGQKLQQEVVEMVVLIYRANSAQNKAADLELLLERLQVVELLLRLCHDMRLIKVSAYASVVEMTASLGKQTQGWRRAAAGTSRVKNK